MARAALSGLLIGLILLVPAVQAQTAAPRTFEDSMAQRSLACTHCHGAGGRAAPDGYHPRIAGKPAIYLYNQLLNFRDGRRHYGPMTQLLAPLSDEYLLAIAEHFAALQLPYPAPLPHKSSAELLERGRTLAYQGDASRQLQACAQCHGQSLTGMLPHVPGLLGLPRDYLNAQLGAWRTGKRRAHAPDCMADIAKRLQPQDIEALASWLAAQAVPAGSAGAPASASASASVSASASAPRGALDPAAACGTARAPQRP
jgi:cytochrome c553